MFHYFPTNTIIQTNMFIQDSRVHKFLNWVKNEGLGGQFQFSAQGKKVTIFPQLFIDFLADF